MIRFENVSKSLAGREVLKDVSFEVEKGGTLVIVGPSGAGKSVTLKHMIRLMSPDAGRVVVGGDVVSESFGRDLERIRRRFGVLFQGAALLEWLNVGENVALPLREKTRMSRKEIESAVREKLDMVGLADDWEKHPSELSGGMRKRAGLARALIEKPEIVLYDEPTSGLDPVSSRSIDALIRDMRDRLRVTSVVVSHDLQSALAIGTKIAMLHDGRIAEFCSPEDFVKSGREEVRAFLSAQYITRSGPWEREVSK